MNVSWTAHQIALRIIGAVVQRLLYLLIIGVVVLLADFMFLSARLRGRGCSLAR